MAFPPDEKRKNDQPRGFQWWWLLLIAIGFVLGVLATLLVAPSTRNTLPDNGNPNPPISSTISALEETKGTIEARMTESAAQGEAIDTNALATIVIDLATRQASQNPTAAP